MIIYLFTIFFLIMTAQQYFGYFLNLKENLGNVIFKRIKF